MHISTPQIVSITSPLASSLVIPSISLLGTITPRLFNPSQYGEVDDFLVPLERFYFSSVHKGVVNRIPKKRKLDKPPSHPDPYQVLLWNTLDAPKKQMD